MAPQCRSFHGVSRTGGCCDPEETQNIGICSKHDPPVRVQLAQAGLQQCGEAAVPTGEQKGYQARHSDVAHVSQYHHGSSSHTLSSSSASADFTLLSDKRKCHL